MSDYLNKVRQHYGNHWGQPLRVLDWPRGPIHNVLPEFRVLVFQRSPKTVAFATQGMSVTSDEMPQELHLLTRSQDAEDAAEPVVELLAATAHFHHTSEPLGLGHTVNFGRAWMAESRCSYGLISRPYLDGPRLEWMKSPKVQFLWLIPITYNEREFKRVHGLEALERRFEQADVDILDPRRASTVADSEVDPG